MRVFLNGQFVSENKAVVSVFDRGFLFGDGLFETLLVLNGKPFRWKAHLERFRRGSAFLNIQPPCRLASLRHILDQLLELNKLRKGLLRLTLSRGCGLPGYSPVGANTPTLVMSAHPLPRSLRLSLGARLPGWKLVIARPRLPAGEALALFKTCNKLPQILARSEADAAGAHEALLLDTEGFVVEGATSNLFWVEHDTVCTPPLDGILAGVTRSVVLELCRSLKINTREVKATPATLKRRSGVFLTLSSWGITEATSLDGHPLKRSPLVAQLRASYHDLLHEETK
jgi:branched-chain amino acid aminotransferase